MSAKSRCRKSAARAYFDLLPKGYSVAVNGAGHFEVFGPDGEVVRMPDGRKLLFASTARSWRAVLNARRDLRRAGLL